MAILKQTRAEKLERSDNDDAKKLEFEKTMARKLNSIFRQVGVDFAAVFSATGQIINTDVYTDEFNTILKSGYRQSSAWFRDNMKRELEKSVTDARTDKDREYFSELLKIRAQTEPDLISTVLTGIVLRAGQQSGFILGTTQEVMGKHVLDTISDAATEGIELTNTEVARQAKKRIDKENLNRSESISETEVQWASEGSKQTEAGILQDAIDEEGVIDPAGQRPFQEKQWFTRGDNSVRTGHRDADQQKRPIKDPFLVAPLSGQALQLLMRPGDTSLGATTNNIINCRCVSIIT